MLKLLPRSGGHSKNLKHNLPVALDELSNELLSPAEVVEVVDSSLIDDLTARRFRSSLSLAFSASSFTDS